MKVFVINCGSSSLKYQLINMVDESVLASGLIERIGMDGSILTHKPEGKDKFIVEQKMENHEVAIKLVLDALVDEKHGVVKSMDEIDAVGHRVLHGGEYFDKSVLITDETMKTIEELIDLGPLHMPANIMGIKSCQNIMPNVPQVATFDTAFHQTIPEHAYIYSIPYEYYEKYKIRKYGFHGTSHKYITERAAFMLGKNVEEVNIVSCHLGNGASLAAIKNGKCIETSMGITPLEGLTMGTRSGDIDPAVIQVLMGKEDINIDQALEILNKKSGVLGISGVSSDFRDIEKAAEEGNHRAQLALDHFTYVVRKYIGAYIGAIGGVDAVVFTAGVGENAPGMRASICKGLEFFGIEVDEEENNMRGKEKDVSKARARVRTFVIPTNEEIVIARDTLELTK
ncbi:acetate kinase [Desulfonispora thiosulfatigenes DSM 11270]|uniref:Acetate kinase n=1 Tax=Desulfonispora thiosulfatigenes DSM 11270 TaxID=656914 RepID=A0A1W1V2F5_DESTI|nr:acetate kinase [Desulfonispora thiosulfatigenes]SMB87466.1 acetate kinase [Desulfonispora thiosulfatigenes DSM 11270]